MVIMAIKDSYKVTGKVLKFWILWIWSFLPLMLAIKGNISEINFEIKKILKSLNKPYVKSIKSPDGDIINCVLINLQPAFDNPLLKNHTIQMKPSSYPKEFSKKHFSKAKPVTQLWQTKGSCPKGTIPIRRMRKKDLIRAQSIQTYAKRSHQTVTDPLCHSKNQIKNGVHEYATRLIRQGAFHGARADINIWSPRVAPSEFSLAQIWIINGTVGVDLNSIEAGWQIYYNLYGDHRPRLFGFFTNDAYRSGCYNLQCSAFVQTQSTVALGAAFTTISAIEGDQYQISLMIFKDPRTGNWWLKNGDTSIGYWPVNLFTHLRDSARVIEWGGEVLNNALDGRHTTTEMGSGRFPEVESEKAASFKDLQIVDQSNQLIAPNNLQTAVTRSDCYDLMSMKNDYWGEFFYYGGPGRNSNCS